MRIDANYALQFNESSVSFAVNIIPLLFVVFVRRLTKREGGREREIARKRERKRRKERDRGRERGYELKAFPVFQHFWLYYGLIFDSSCCSFCPKALKIQKKMYQINLKAEEMRDGHDQSPCRAGAECHEKVGRIRFAGLSKVCEGARKKCSPKRASFNLLKTNNQASYCSRTFSLDYLWKVLFFSDQKYFLV